MADTKEIVNLALLENFIKIKKPSLPVYAVRPESLKEKTQQFVGSFNGKVLYSVKSNPSVATLKHLHDAGIRTFDVASINEVRLITSLFPTDVELFFMHPVKSREAIREAYFQHKIKTFSLDTLEELDKIREETDDAQDLSLHVRLAISDETSVFNLSSKFGIAPTKAKDLIQATRKVAKTFGICFHVGSQCLDPRAYERALSTVSWVIEDAEVKLDVIDVGGGFPAKYPTMSPPALEEYLTTINSSVQQLREEIKSDCEAWCEPGRALVAESGSLVVRVEGRKGTMLCINDGTYGGLFDAGVPAFTYPTRVIRPDRNVSKHGELDLENEVNFGFYGPTCDSMDTMRGPFPLPSNIAEGDYIEIGQLGAYSKGIRTDFNGFNETIEIEVSDRPLTESF